VIIAEPVVRLTFNGSPRPEPAVEESDESQVYGPRCPPLSSILPPPTDGLKKFTARLLTGFASA